MKAVRSQATRKRRNISAVKAENYRILAHFTLEEKMMTPSFPVTDDTTNLKVESSASAENQSNVSLDSSGISTTSNLLTPDEALAGKTAPFTAGKGYVMRKCRMPPQSELEPIEMFVLNAIQSKNVDAPDPAHEQGYRAIVDALKRPVDPPMLRMVLIALRTAGNGGILNRLTTDPAKHAQLIHFLFRFNSALTPKFPEGDDTEHIVAVFKDGSLLDAHLHLILAMVSARTINLIPALTAVWRMITDTEDLSEDL